MILTNYSIRPHEVAPFPTLMSKRSTIGLLIDSTHPYGRGLLRGVQSYIRKHTSWNVVIPERGRGRMPWRPFGNWEGQGIIAAIENDAIAKIVKELGVPTINVSATRIMPEAPSVDTDDELVASIAFDHAYEQGFRHFAYCGVRGAAWSDLRRDAFVRCARLIGMDCSVYESRRRRSWRDGLQALVAWLEELPRPLAVMASHDHLGRELLHACQAANAMVPQEIAVIGVGNDELVCDLANPPLSSVAPDMERIGYEAARFLSRLIEGNHVPAETRIPPIGVVARCSTDSYAIDDPEVAAAARYIRNHAVQGIKVKDVLDAVPTSRRVLEKGFRAYLGRTPHEEILRVQLGHVGTLLRETDLSLEKIALRCGFRHVEYMTVVFKRELGVTPSEFRKRRA